MTAVIRWYLRQFGLVAAVVALVACTPAKQPIARHIAHGAVLAVAQAVRVADLLCTDKAQKMLDDSHETEAFALAEDCAKQYQTARKALLVAAYAVDGWGDAAQNGKAACALSEAAISLRLLVETLRAVGVVDLPRELGDGLAAAAFIADQIEARTCEVSK